MKAPSLANEDLLVVGSEACVLLSGPELELKWTVHITQVLRYKVLLQGMCLALRSLTLGAQGHPSANGAHCPPPPPPRLPSDLSCSSSRRPIFGRYKPDTWAVVLENGTNTNRQV